MLQLLRVFPLLVTSAVGQQSLPASLQPATTELSRDTAAVLMGPGCRVQQFYELVEVATVSERTLRLTAVSLRFDGPSAGARSVRHTIDNLTLRVGATHRNVDQVGSVFDSNLTLPLATVFRATNYEFITDEIATSSPEPWGGPHEQLRFEFSSPAMVVVPAGGSLVFELIARGNSNAAGTDPARLDFYIESAAVASAGTSVAAGVGCAPATITLDTRGQYDPGTAFSVVGRGHEPGTPIVTLLTARLLPTLLFMPGAPSCWLYVDLSTGGVSHILIADPGGEATGEIPVPRAPQLCGARIYIQNVGFTPGSPRSGLQASNYRTIEIGCTTPPVTRGWHTANPTDPDASIATVSVAGGLAMRIE